MTSTCLAARTSRSTASGDRRPAWLARSSARSPGSKRMSERLRKRSRPAGGWPCVAASRAAGALRRLVAAGAVARVNGSARAPSHSSTKVSATRPPRANLGQRLAAQSSPTTAAPATAQPASVNHCGRCWMTISAASSRTANAIAVRLPQPRARLVPLSPVAVSPCRRRPRVPVVSVPPCLRGRRQRIQPERSQRSHPQRKQLQPACRRTEQVEAGDHAPQQIVERVVRAEGEQKSRRRQQRRALHVPRGPRSPRQFAATAATGRFPPAPAPRSPRSRRIRHSPRCRTRRPARGQTAAAGFAPASAAAVRS